jgi:hypothetical protein
VGSGIAFVRQACALVSFFPGIAYGLGMGRGMEGIWECSWIAVSFLFPFSGFWVLFVQGRLRGLAHSACLYGIWNCDFEIGMEM